MCSVGCGMNQGQGQGTAIPNRSNNHFPDEVFHNMWCNLLAELDLTNRTAQQYSLDHPPPHTHTHTRHTAADRPFSVNRLQTG